MHDQKMLLDLGKSAAVAANNASTTSSRVDDAVLARSIQDEVNATRFSPDVRARRICRCSCSVPVLAV